MIAYSSPAITDHGSLVDLTADFDLHFVGSVAKVISLAAVSPAIGGGIPGGNGSPPLAPPEGAAQGAGVLGGGDPGASPDVLGGEPKVAADVGSGGPGDPGDAGGLAGDEAGGAGDPGGVGGGGGGDLPFTGYFAMMPAAVGATMVTAGVALRAKLRRKS